ncbi:hypothetical protein J1N35_023099 [Gossypium stocksii]|uniref:Uncharacterized protein n=1 Tax=Gossypium stocksii TaxID=47602 RepID=A0A9D3VHV5_9ROSI|nr:hypothetical protein J1N35_023099 [Gossypium stocksii]
MAVAFGSNGGGKERRDFVFLFGFFMESKIAGLTTNGGEEEAWQLNLEGDELVSSYEFCFFGCFLTIGGWQGSFASSTIFSRFGLKVHDFPRGLMSQVRARQ